MRALLLQLCILGVWLPVESTARSLHGDTASLLQSRLAQSSSAARHKHPFRVERHDHHHAKVVDTSDYRDDAAAFFEKVKNDPLEKRCPLLKKMTLGEVGLEWEKYLAQVHRDTIGANASERLGALYDLHFEFNSLLNDDLPVLVTGHVPKQLGWQAATHWGQDEFSAYMADAKWQRFTFNYPEWLIGTQTWESVNDYITHNENAQNIFLFASEGGCADSDLKRTVDKIRGQFAPSPGFAYGPEECMAIVAIDKLGSSHGFHSHDPVWNVQIEGYKMWWLLPPDYTSSESDPDGTQVWGAAPLLPDGKAFEYPNACAMLEQTSPPPGALTCVTAPGEMLLLPNEWIHSTCGITDFTAAAGGWLAHHDHP